jgi:hypothetical protein
VVARNRAWPALLAVADALFHRTTAMSVLFSVVLGSVLVLAMPYTPLEQKFHRYVDFFCKWVKCLAKITCSIMGSIVARAK